MIGSGVQGRGNPDNHILLLGEKPGHEELRKGKVWVGRGGLELDKILWKVGIKQEDVWLDNLLADAPTGEDWSVTDEDISRNMGHLLEVMDRVRPSTIISMGGVSNRFLLGNGVRSDMATVHGLLHRVPNRFYSGSQGQEDQIRVFSTYHPAAGLHGDMDHDPYPMIMHDFRLAATIINTNWEPEERKDQWPEPHYTVITDSDSDLKYLKGHVWQAIDGVSHIFVDTEGSVKKPWCLTFSIDPGEAFMIQPKSKKAIQLLANLVDASGTVVVCHYAVHDIPVLRSMGWDLPTRWNGNPNLIHDTMVAAYNLQIEPQGLKNLCYRHCGMEMNDYVDLVSPYSLDKRLDWLLSIGAIDWGKPDPVLVESKTSSKVVQPEKLNTRVQKVLNKLENDPDSVDLWKWWKDTYDELKQPVIEQIGDIPTATLDDVPFMEALRYACADADGTGRVYHKLMSQIGALALTETYLMDCAVIPHFEEMQTTGFCVNVPYFEKLRKIYRGEQGKIRKELAEKWTEGVIINPESSPQARYWLFDKWKLPVFKETDGGEASTSDKAIDWLKDRHPGVGLIAQHREYDKAVSSFVEPSIVAGATDTGRAMGSLKYTRVVSGRPSMSDLNLLAFPVRSAIGKEIRNGYEAGEGNLLGSWDLNQVEMRFMAHESEDPDLIQAYLNDADIHKETASRMFGIRISDVDNEQREVAKRISFGVITGIQGRGLRDQFYLNGITKYSESDCDDFIRIWFDARRRVKDYLESCRAEARRYGFVRESVGGRIRYLQSIQSTNKKIAAEAERASHSHKISAGAQSILKKAKAALWPIIEEIRRTDGVWIKWILQIYDELIIEFPKGYEVILDPIVTEVLCNTTKLRVPIKAKGKWAKTWGKLK